MSTGIHTYHVVYVGGKYNVNGIKCVPKGSDSPETANQNMKSNSRTVRMFLHPANMKFVYTRHVYNEANLFTQWRVMVLYTCLRITNTKFA